jgi:acyl carrier protein
MELKNRLTKVFRTVFDNDSIELIPELTADDVDEWDSLSHMNLMIAIELEFDIEFEQNEVLNFANVGELMAGIQAKTAHPG